MKYLLILAVLAAFTLTACSDPKPAQYPPSLYKDFEDPLTDEELAEVQRKGAEKRAEKEADEVEEEADDAEDAAEEADEAEEEIDSDASEDE